MILHILKKDVRHLWGPIALTLVLLAVLAREDRWRMDWMPGLNEGWLNLLLPLAWATLTALVIQEEALTGDRQFWITRPYRRGKLLAAKALFLLLCIHAPAMIADGYIVAGRGFSPLKYLPQLLTKQMLLAGALVLPAAALAALTRNLVQFLLGAIAIPVGVLFFASSMRAPFSRPSEQHTREALAIIAIGTVGGVVLLLRYLARRPVLSRALAAAGALVGAAILIFAPPEFSAVARAALSHPPGSPVIRLVQRDSDVDLQSSWYMPNMVTAALPITIESIPDGSRIRVEPLTLTVLAAASDRYAMPARIPYRPFEKIPVMAYFQALEGRKPWLMLRLDRAVYARLESSPVRVYGRAMVSFYRRGETTWMPVGSTESAPEVGRCTAMEIEDYSGGGLKVVCESPAGVPRFTAVRLTSQADGREWRGRWLGDASVSVPGPRQAWLSPVERQDAFFRASERDWKAPGGQWLIPRTLIGSLKIGVTPDIDTGYAVVDYDLTDVPLSRFVLPPRQ